VARSIALFSSAIPYTVETRGAATYAGGSTFGVLMSLEPAIATGVGFVMLGQVLRTHGPGRDRLRRTGERWRELVGPPTDCPRRAGGYRR
jgi:hypothetical protein